VEFVGEIRRDSGKSLDGSGIAKVTPPRYNPTSSDSREE
jgi:hypothetical protein